MATTFSLPVSRVTIGEWDMIRSSWPFTCSVFWSHSSARINKRQAATVHGSIASSTGRTRRKTDRDFGGMEERRMQRRRFHSRAHSLAPSLKIKEFLEEGKMG